jgi:hypothetical protein
MNTLFYFQLLAFLAVTAAGTVDLGSAGDYAILASSTITLGGDSTVTGKVGLAPGTSIVGVLPQPGVVAAVQGPGGSFVAKTDLGVAYLAAATAKCNSDESAGGNSACVSENNLSSQDLGDMTLAPGVYTFASTAALTGTAPLTLAGTGSADDEWIFQIGSAMLFAANTEVICDNCVSGRQVTWQVSSSASIMANAKVIGDVLAYASITAATPGVVVDGRLLAKEGAVTIDNTVVNGVSGGVEIKTKPVRRLRSA